MSDVEKSLKLLARTSVVVFIGLLISKIATYLYRSMVVRYYGLEVYGFISLALMVSGWISVFVCLGLPDGLLRFMSIYRAKAETSKIGFLFKKSIYFLFITSIIGGILLFIFSGFIAETVFHNSDLTIFLQVFAFVVPVMAISNPFMIVTRAYERINAYSMAVNILPNILKIAILGIAILFGFSYLSVPYSNLLALLLVLVISIVYTIKYLPEIYSKYKIPSSEQSQILKSLLAYSWPLLFLSILSSVYAWVDTFAIGYFKTALDVGLYNTAVPISLLLAIAPELFMQIFFPMIAKEFAMKNKNSIKELSKQVSKWIFALNLPILSMLLLFPGAFINILFGSDSLGALTALRYLSIGAFFTSLATVSSSLISVAGRSKMVLGNILLTAALNLILNIILVPKYGINGAAFSTMVSVIVLSIMLTIESKIVLNLVPLRKKMVHILAAGGISSLILLYLRSIISINVITIILLASIYAVIYLALILLFKALDKHDIMIFKAFWKKIGGKNGNSRIK